MTLTSENYYSIDANVEYMSVSQFKDFLKCESAALAKVRGEWQSETTLPMLVGSYVDSWFEGTLDEFKQTHPEIFMKNGELKSDYRHAEKMIERVKRDAYFMRGMDGAKQVIMTGNISGVPFKIKIDSLREDSIVDLKTCKDFEGVWNDVTRKREHFISYWSYDIQGACYQAIVEQNTGLHLPFFIFAVTKEKPEPDINSWWIPDNLLESKLGFVKSLINRFDSIKKGKLKPTRCGKCAYCRSTKVLTAPINLIKDMEVYNGAND